MKTKIFAIISFLLIFCFISCSNVLEEKEEISSGTATVSFNFGNERAIVSTATPAEYTYTLKGTFKGNTSTLCEKLSYEDFISKSFTISHGEWTFEITAYKNNTAVYGGSVTQTLVEGNNNVSFTLRAVTGGSGSLSITLKYPASADVKTILAGLYDSIPSSIPDVASDPAECKVFSPEASTSSVTFECASIPSGENKFVEFFIYDSQDVYIGSYLESVFLISGDSFELERTLSAVNSFSATVYLTVQGQPWNDSGSVLKAVKDGKEYLLQAGPNTNTYTASLPLGTYDIYNSIVDTGIDLTVRTNNSSNITVNYDSAIRYATAEDICDVIDSLTEETTTVCVIGDFSEDNFPSLNSAISTQYSNKPNCKFVLDLQQVSNLTTIPNDALLGCRSLIEVKLPDSVTTIGDDAFAACTYLESIKIPSSVTSLGVEALGHCIRLETVEIQSSVTEIPDFAFQNCASLSSIEIPSSVTTIGHAAFRGCMQLKSIEIPSLVTSIGREAFSGCSGLESIEIPSSVTSIGREAFHGCSGLESIEIPSSVTTIADSAFESCSNLKSIEIPSSVTSIGKLAFKWCSKLQTINFEGTEAQWNAIDKGENWNADCPDNMKVNFSFIEATLMNVKEIISGLTHDATLVINGELFVDELHNLYALASALTGSQYDIKIVLDLRNGTGLTKVGDFSSGCKKIAKILLPDTVTDIDMGAFNRCTGLESVEIPNSVTSIGDDAFHGCTSLKSIKIPNSVTRIGEDVFRDCTGLESVVFPESVISFGMCVFKGCTSLKSVEIPNSWKSIPVNFFDGCTGLEIVKIPVSLISISDYAFYGCEKLHTINYAGTEEQWKSISKDSSWNTGCPSNMVINYNYQAE